MATNAITAPTYDPTSTAKALADKYISGAQTQLTNQTKAASDTAKALSTLSGAISTFQTSLASLAGIGHSMLAQSATLSDTTLGTATAKSTATPGTYSVFVKQVATPSQLAYNVADYDLSGEQQPDGTYKPGMLKLNLADPADLAATPVTINVDLAAADTDKNGTLTARELAAAINQSGDNAGKVTAGIVTIGTGAAATSRLVLTSTKTGAANTISLDTSGVLNANLKTALDAAPTVTSTAQDAIVNFGDPSDSTTEVKQASNTFTNIDGVSFTATKAQAPGATPITLTVGSDTSGTTANVQAFVDAYNKLKSALDGLVSAGDPDTNVAAGAFSHDAGVTALRNRVIDLLRPGGVLSLASYGITAARDGTISLDSTRLQKQLAVNPTGLDTLIGSASASAPSGVAGSLNTYLNTWTKGTTGTTGQIKQRTDANTTLQTSLTSRQADLDTRYDAAYQRYLKQYTALQALQSTMQNNSSMFSALFTSDSSN
jgi:flagellar hook-associated protein 2